MYTKDQDQTSSAQRVRPPDNYGGTAFRSDEGAVSGTVSLPPGLLSDGGRGTYISNTPVKQPRSSYIKESSERHKTKEASKQTIHSPNEAGIVNSYDDETPISSRGEYMPEVKGAYEEDPGSGENQNSNESASKETHAKEQSKNPLKGLLSSFMPPGLGKGGSGEFGFEEILIIGLILLLSQGEGDKDILLLLALLFFCQ